MSRFVTQVSRLSALTTHSNIRLSSLLPLLYPILQCRYQDRDCPENAVLASSQTMGASLRVYRVDSPFARHCALRWGHVPTRARTNPLSWRASALYSAYQARPLRYQRAWGITQQASRPQRQLDFNRHWKGGGRGECYWVFCPCCEISTLHLNLCQIEEGKAFSKGVSTMSVEKALAPVFDCGHQLLDLDNNMKGPTATNHLRCKIFDTFDEKAQNHCSTDLYWLLHIYAE